APECARRTTHRCRGDRRDPGAAGPGAAAGAVVSVPWGVLEHPGLVALGWLVILSLLVTAVPALVFFAWSLLRSTASARNKYRAAVIAFGVAAVLALVAIPLLLVGPALVPPRLESMEPPLSTPLLRSERTVGPV